MDNRGGQRNTDPTVEDPAACARAALDAAYTDPRRALILGAAAVAHAGDDAETVSVAEQAMGLASAATGDLATARRYLDAAVAGAPSARRAADARGALAYVLTLLGDPGRALRELDAALPDADGVPGARLRMQRALVLDESGRFAEAAAGYADALTVLADTGGDPLVEASIRNNRSILRVRLGDWRGAEEDLRRAEHNYTVTGHIGRLAMVAHNRGLAAAMRGDVPAALAAFDDAAARYVGSGRDPGLLPVEHAEVLLSVGLVPEARALAQSSVDGFDASGNATDLVQARIMLASAALGGGDAAVALDAAERADHAATAQHRPGWAALARYLALRARWDLGDRSAAAVSAGRTVVAALLDAGWDHAVTDARVIVARMALEAGQPETARTELAAAARARRSGTAQARVRAWHATALARLSAGDRRGAFAAVGAGLGVLDGFRAGLGSTELRVHASGHGRELAELGIRLAMDSAPGVLLRWAERLRAMAARQQPVRPPDDAELDTALAALRQVRADVVTAVTGGRDPGSLLRAQTAAEHRVRRVARHAGAAASAPDAFDRGALTLTLGRRVLVEYVIVDDELHALTVRDGRVSRHPLGPLAPVARDLEILRFSLRSTAYGLGSIRSLTAATRRIDDTAARLDAALLGPFAAITGDRELVVVPTGVLHGLPWSMLPTCACRPVSVTPSAQLWWRSMTRPVRTDGPTVLVSGPDLPGAAAEVADLASTYPDAAELSGARAGAAAVLSALDGARTAHVAAHGSLRADNPQFSSLRLADGPITVYDLERLKVPPQLVVLSACDAGLHAVHTGDEVTGLAAALLAIGSRVLLAPVLPIPDHASRPVMRRVHDHLVAGLSPAAALAAARVPSSDSDPAQRAAEAAFQCFGAG